jgi:hypothetical protein
MKRLVTSTALAMALGLAAGAVLVTASPAEAQCVRAGALDLNGDKWIDGDERDLARNAGFTNFDSNGDLFVSADEMNSCLNGGARAFAWLRSANPSYASAGSYMGPSDMTAPSASYAPTTAGYTPSYDRGAAFDTPAPQARDAAMAYLQSKVQADPRYQPRVVVQTYQPLPAPTVIGAIEPAAGRDLLREFATIDVNGDGVLSAQEYVDYMSGGPLITY